MREPEGYRQQLELLTEIFPNRAALKITECAFVLNLDRRTLLADRSFPAKKVGSKYSVPITELARWMVKR